MIFQVTYKALYFCVNFCVIGTMDEALKYTVGVWRSWICQKFGRMVTDLMSCFYCKYKLNMTEIVSRKRYNIDKVHTKTNNMNQRKTAW